MDKSEWVICPICENKTRIRVREDTERLKITGQMQWIGLMNTVKAQVDEIIFAELIYK